MLSILSEEKAEAALREKIREMEKRGSLDEEGLHRIEGKSFMLGCLIARTKQGQETVSYAFSGSFDGCYLIKGWGPPCFSVSSFEKIVDEYDSIIHCYSDRIELGEKDLEPVRRSLSNECQEKIFGNYTFHTPSGSVKFSDMKLKAMPPSGTGDCAAAKLLSWCFKRGWEPLSLCEIYYGHDSTLRQHLHSYPPCDEKCALILKHIFTLDIIYSDDDIVVVNKEAGMLSVPGKGEDKADCVSSRVKKIFPSAPLLPSIHRLDMDTSGLLVLAKNEKAKSFISRQFEDRSVEKTYIALLDGLVKEERGTIDLPLRLDTDNRPYQIVDLENGKKAVTQFERLSVEIIDGRTVTRVRFTPHTGRTHQLRVHSASGLKCPILGDRLYGSRKEGERLALHAQSLSFIHPSTGERVSFSSPAPF